MERGKLARARVREEGEGEGKEEGEMRSKSAMGWHRRRPSQLSSHEVRAMARLTLRTAKASPSIDLGQQRFTER